MPEHSKAALAWGGYGLTKWLEMLGIHSWGDFAGMAAGIYSLLLIGEWIWKKTKQRRGQG